ncbi:hypothetical protein [Nostoc sp.]|uniref:hypothetical protein n=1 Tax=Nostoc sp. TaxID=1180 RepID=UPI002FF49F71
MQNLTNFPSLIDRWLRYKFQTILVVCFLLWTPLLVIETLQIQHSCHPMIHWSGTLPAECQPKPLQPNFNSPKKPEIKGKIVPRDETPLPKPSPTPQPTEKRNPIEEAIKMAKEHPDITGGFIGIGVGITVGVTAVATAPLAVAVGIGAAVWFVIRTGFSNIS